MSLRRALVDKARRVYNREDPNGPWREGSPKAETMYGPWVRVRFRRQVESESGDVTVNESGGLLIDLKDMDGNPTFVNGRFIAWDADDRVQIQSIEGEDELWNVSSGVRPLRRRKGFVGFRCDIQLSREATVDEGALPHPDLDALVVGPGAARAASTAPVVPAEDPWEHEGG